MKVVSTDQKQANNLTRLIICFLSNGYFFLLSMIKPLQSLIYFYLENLHLFY